MFLPRFLFVSGQQMVVKSTEKTSCHGTIIFCLLFLYAQSNVAVIRKPWEWQKKVYQNLELHLDAAIDKVDNLSKDVEIQKMEKKWDELYEQTHQEKLTEHVQTQPVALVSEKEFEYGADAFEAYQKEGKVKPDMVKK